MIVSCLRVQRYSFFSIKQGFFCNFFTVFFKLLIIIDLIFYKNTILF